MGWYYTVFNQAGQPIRDFAIYVWATDIAAAAKKSKWFSGCQELITHVRELTDEQANRLEKIIEGVPGLDLYEARKWGYTTSKEILELIKNEKPA